MHKIFYFSYKIGPYNFKDLEQKIRGINKGIDEVREKVPEAHVYERLDTKRHYPLLISIKGEDSTLQAAVNTYLSTSVFPDAIFQWGNGRHLIESAVEKCGKELVHQEDPEKYCWKLY